MRISLFGDNSDQLRVGTVGRIYQKKKRKEKKLRKCHGVGKHPKARFYYMIEMGF
jgi:hypothetical protein